MINKFFLFILFFCFLDVKSQCNGSFQLCDKKYNEVAFLTTHNAFNSSEDNFQFPNQTYNILNQLNAGVRGLMIDVYDNNGTPMVYHSFSILGSIPLLDIFNDIKSFLDLNTNEIVTLILECYIDANSIENVLQQSLLNNYLYSKDSQSNWATLDEMITSNKRLIIFSDQNDASSSQSWYHYVWDYAVETHFSVSDINDFSCEYNRGDSTNDLFIFNHFLTDDLFGYGLYNESLSVNSNPFFIDRVTSCWQSKNKFPNFLTVDFVELGDAQTVVNQINDKNTNINESFSSFEKILIDIKDILGRSITSASHNRVVFRIYNDGSVSKQLNVN